MLIAASRAFVEREEVHVVVDPDRRVVLLLEAAPDVEPVPAGHDRRSDGPARFEVDGTGDAHRDAPHRNIRGLRQHLIDHRVRSIERFGGAAGDVPLGVRLLEDIALEHRYADVDVQPAESTRDDATAIGAKTQGAGRAPTGRGPECAVFEVAHLDRLVDALRHDPTTEAGDAPDLGSGRRVAVSNHVDDPKKARHFVGLSAEAQGGLRCHGRFLHDGCRNLAISSNL